MNEREFAELAAGFALDALSPDDLAAFLQARAQHPEWERFVAADVATAASLADGVSRVAPPPQIRTALLARIAGMTQGDRAETQASTSAPVIGVPETEILAVEPEPPVAEPELSVAEPELSVAETEPTVTEPAAPATDDGEPATGETTSAEPPPNTATIQTISRRNWTRGILALAASLVLLVTLGFGAVTLGQFINRPAAVVALEQIENAPDAQAATAEVADGGTATVHWSESLGKVVLVSDGLPSIAKDQSFEMWFVRDDGVQSAGTFDNASDATVLLDGTLQAGDTIAVTVEQQGGSPTGEPTTEPIVAIPTA
ncbi:anti-sigma factor [Microbacterium pumilum]|uniref:Regulator of SigK n=1 Tax=Microbacterium pumilum TaxID=344165 RepID=A0ABN2SYW5_9MICO